MMLIKSRFARLDNNGLELHTCLIVDASAIIRLRRDQPDVRRTKGTRKCKYQT